MGITIDSEFEYSIIKANNEKYIMAKELVKKVMELAGIEKYEIEKTFKGKELDRTSRVIIGSEDTVAVELDTGTGAVHTAPGYGKEDYLAGLKNGLDIVVTVDAKGHQTEEAGPFAGMFYAKSDKVILQWLEEHNLLLHKQELMHSYPHCWRCKKPVIYRATNQWFASVDGFRKETLETLRGPLEDKEVTISRLWASLTYPCNFMLIASMNPCPCGYYGSSIKNCICSPTSIKRYLSKLSGPLLDRIDINVNIQPLEYQNFKENEKIETSKQIKERVEKAIKMQRERYANMDILYNSELTPKLIERYCKLDNVGNKIMEKAFINYGLTARTYTRILKVARTIADLEGNMKITAKNIAEAIQYRFVN